jgi:ribose/xylose/arabinose/galactoside ABC-type transport system permease subunit
MLRRFERIISACVLGGVSLLAAATMGVLIGVLIMGTVNNVMNLTNVDAFTNMSRAAQSCWPPCCSIN